MSNWTGQTLNGRFRVEDRLGQGGMAAVYLASDERLEGRRVVVKHPLREADRFSSGLSDDELRRRFRGKVSRLIQLDDIPGVVPILDQGVHEGTPFYVMRHMAGGSLADLLREGPQAPGEALAWLRPIAAALDALHERNVLHRDVKPENLLFDLSPLGPKGGKARAHLADFGIVKELAVQWATTGQNTAIGTPGFVAPEEFAPDAEPDGRADQYALAATLYVALTGSKPQYATTGGKPASWLDAGRKRLVSPSSLAPHVPAACSAAIEKALSRDFEDRYPTCAAFVQAFEAALDAAELGGATGAATAAPTRRASAPGVATLGRSEAPRPARRGRRRWPLLLLALATLVGVGYAVLPGLLSGSAQHRDRRAERLPAPPSTAPAPALAPVPTPAPAPAPAPDTQAPEVQAAPAWARVWQAQKDEAARLKVPVAYEEAETGLRFVLIPGGSFQMGSPEGEAGRASDEGPVHRVTLQAYYLSVTEVTNAQYKRFKSDHDGLFDGPTQPVERVSHEDAEAFARWLNGRAALKGYRLPSEAEWEHAARAGTSTRWSFGDDESRLGEYGWFSGNSGSRTHPVGEKLPNPLGLYDMHGNVWEWCADDWHDDYEGAPTDGSAWIDSPRASFRVLRGGGWSGDAQVLRSADRYWVAPSGRNDSLGFRLARPVTAR